jgi:hypothetical protein
MATLKKKSEFKVGQWVWIQFGGNSWRAQLIEDRGNLGVKGERVFMISIPREDGDEPREFEIGESQVLRAA